MIQEAGTTPLELNWQVREELAVSVQVSARGVGNGIKVALNVLVHRLELR